MEPHFCVCQGSIAYEGEATVGYGTWDIGDKCLLIVSALLLTSLAENEALCSISGQ
jgi:hypothetical protein